MKKFLLTLFVLFSAILSLGNPALCDESITISKTVIEIGTLANQDKTDEALEKCLKALETNPNNKDLLYWNATILIQKNKGMEALEIADKALIMYPDYLEFNNLRGEAMEKIGNKSAALEEYNNVIKKDPKNISAYLLRGTLKLEMGDYTGAMDDTNKATTLMNEELAK